MNNTPISSTASHPAPAAQDPSVFETGINIANATRILDMPLIPDTRCVVQSGVVANVENGLQTQTRVAGGNWLDLAATVRHGVDLTPTRFYNASGTKELDFGLNYRPTAHTTVGVGRQFKPDEHDAPAYTYVQASHVGDAHVVSARVFSDPQHDTGLDFSSASIKPDAARYQLNSTYAAAGKSTHIEGNKGLVPLAPASSSSTQKERTQHYTVETAVDVPIADIFRLGAAGHYSGKTRYTQTTDDATDVTHQTLRQDQMVQYAIYAEVGFLPEDDQFVRLSFGKRTRTQQRFAGVNGMTPETIKSQHSVQMELGLHGQSPNGRIAYSLAMGVDTDLASVGSSTITTPNPTGNGAANVGSFMATDAMYIRAQVTADLGPKPKPQPNRLY